MHAYQVIDIAARTIRNALNTAEGNILLAQIIGNVLDEETKMKVERIEFNASDTRANFENRYNLGRIPVKVDATRIPYGHAIPIDLVEVPNVVASYDDSISSSVAKRASKKHCN